MPKSTLTYYDKVRDRYEVISLVDDGTINVFEASEALNISVRQIFRMLSRFRLHERTKDCFKFKPRGNPRKKKEETIQAIINLKKERPERSISVIAEKVSNLCEQVSKSTVKNILSRNNLYTKRYKLKYKKKAYQRFEAPAFGHIWQMDTSIHYFLPDYGKVSLILILDDYSRMIISFAFVEADSTWNNMLVLKAGIEKYGIPKILYTDNSSKFKTTRHESRFQQFKPNEYYETEIQHVLFNLGIVPLTHRAYHPEAKGKIERIFRFIQDRFVNESKATNLTELNEEFEGWKEWYNNERIHKTIGCVPYSRIAPSVARKVAKGINLDDIFCVTDTRKVRKDNAILFQGREFYLDRRINLANQEVEIKSTPTKFRIYHKSIFIQEFSLI